MFSPKEWKLNINFHQNIFSEIIKFQENGGSGGIQNQIPNCHFYIALGYQHSGFGNQNEYHAHEEID